jgi:hypothetical protein
LGHPGGGVLHCFVTVGVVAGWKVRG